MKFQAVSMHAIQFFVIASEWRDKRRTRETEVDPAGRQRFVTSNLVQTSFFSAGRF